MKISENKGKKNLRNELGKWKQGERERERERERGHTQTAKSIEKT